MGICKGVLTFFDPSLCCLQDWLFDFSVRSFCEKVGLSWVPCVKFGLFWLSRLKFGLNQNDTFCGIWLLWPSFWQNFLYFAYPPSGPPDNAFMWLMTFCKQERIINETTKGYAKNPWQRLKTKLTYFKDCQWLPLTCNWLTIRLQKHVPRAGSFVAHMKYLKA